MNKKHLKRKKGSWAVILITLIPLILVIFVQVIAVFSQRSILKTRIQSQLDISSIYLSETSTVFYHDEQKYCLFDKVQSNEDVQTRILPELIMTMNGYNPFWEIYVYTIEYPEGIWVKIEEFVEPQTVISEVTLDDDSIFINNSVIRFTTTTDEEGGFSTETGEVIIRAYITKKIVDNYRSYYATLDFDTIGKGNFFHVDLKVETTCR